MKAKEEKIEKYIPQMLEKKWPHYAKAPRGKQKRYDPGFIELKWQKIWEEEKLYSPDLDNAKNPFYNLMMFPYPSAEGMHVGNMYAFSGSDIFGRFQRMKGYDVFEPMGLDGFGIHSENYAITVGRHPKEQAKVSESNFYRQLRATGNAFDWSRTVETYDPKYYKWTQWLFIQMFKAGLAYRKKAPVNFCPSCKTVLADEQVADGLCERCNSTVEKRDLEQWFFKITNYVDRLLNGLSQIDWAEKVKIAQKQWIGKKEGINITYEVEESSEKIVCFTTRPDTNFGATFIVLGPEHPLIYKITKKEYSDKVKKYVDTSYKKSEAQRLEEGKKKTGVFSGSYATNNLNGKKLPIWIGDFVLGNVGTGAVIGVPGHDIRDFEFAKEFNLPIIRVVVGSDGDRSTITSPEQVQEKEGKMINSDFLDDLDIHDATKKVMDYLEKKGWGKRVTVYHLRDWLISRQRYWGPPIPMIYCEQCGWNPVDEKDLPVCLPNVKDWKPLGTGKSPLANHPEFYETTCPVCRGPAKRETDVSDTFLDSSWYFLRYLATDWDDAPFPSEAFVKNSRSQITSSKQISSIKSKTSKIIGNLKLEIGNSAQRAAWLPVDMYIGGAEHSVLHLMYVRFVAMVLSDLDYLEFEEPFPRFFAHGLLIKEGTKMSKSKGNIVVPDIYIQKFGADTLRLYLMFLGPYSHGGDFHDSGVEGMHRFVKRIWSLVISKLLLVDNLTKNQEPRTHNQLRMMHRTIKKVTEDIERLHYNTAIAALMEYYNFLTKQKGINKEEVEVFLKLLAPFAPHMTEELWQRLRCLEITADLKADLHGYRRKSAVNPWQSIHGQSWPKYDQKFLEEETSTIIVQVNGKVRDTIEVEKQNLKDKNYVEKKAQGCEKIIKHLEGKSAGKIIYVEGKVINFVIN